jgi:hypothetical protein
MPGLQVGHSTRWSVRATIIAAVALWIAALAPAATAHVAFPSYPRIAVPGAPPADGTLATASSFPGGLAWLIPAAALAALAGFALLVIVRRRRPGAPEAT